METLSTKEIIISIIIGYLITSYIHAELNPFNLSVGDRILQVVNVFIIAYLRLLVKFLNK